MFLRRGGKLIILKRDTRIRQKNKRYFYQLDGEGIRYEILTFLKMIGNPKYIAYVDDSISYTICEVFNCFNEVGKKK